LNVTAIPRKKLAVFAHAPRAASAVRAGTFRSRQKIAGTTPRTATSDADEDRQRARALHLSRTGTHWP
jgi:hypothetical protein